MTSDHFNSLLVLTQVFVPLKTILIVLAIFSTTAWTIDLSIDVIAYTWAMLKQEAARKLRLDLPTSS